MKTIITLFAAILCFTNALVAQNVGINSDGTVPHSSAMLDIKSTSGGILIPRMTEAQKNAIGTPATGLMVYQTNNTPGFYYYNGSAWTLIGTGSGSESDPVFTASPAKDITGTNITNWNTAYGWGNHASAGYLKTYSETDPVFGASAAHDIAGTNITNWNTAYGWGNHASAGYLTTYSETDPVFIVSPAFGINSGDISNWNAKVSSQWTTSGSDIYYNTGKVGIGTATPGASYKLDVNGSINGTSVLVNGVAVASSTDTYWSTAGTGKIYYTGGNVGVGTATPAYPLDVTGDVNVTGTFRINGTAMSGTGTVTSVSAGNGMNFTAITGSGSVTLGTPSTLTNATTNSVSGTTHSHAITTQLPSSSTAGVMLQSGTKTAGGFYGGTTDPSSTTRANYDGYLYATKFYGDGSGLSGITATGYTGTLPVANGGTGTTTGSITGTGALTFTAGGSNQNVNITPSGTGFTVLGGNVGIGGSWNSGFKLNIDDASTTASSATLRINKTGAISGDGYGVSVSISGASNDTYAVRGLASGTGANNISVMGQSQGAAASNYGVYGVSFNGTSKNYGVYGGTSGSTGTTSVAGWFQNTSTPVINKYGIFSEATGANGTNYGGYFTASGATTNYALVTNAGNVGIGNTTPAYKLDVAGDVNISTGSAYRINGVAINSGTVSSVSGTSPISVATSTTTPVISISAATTLAAGSMSETDKTKLDGIATGANNYSHPTGDGNLHVIATSTTNSGKVLTAGATAGSLSWTTPTMGTVTSVTGTSPISVTTGSTPAISLGTVGVANGGTGQTTYAVGDLLYASTTSALSKLADVATGNALISGGVGVAPSWGKIALTTHVSGTLPVANGGTGATTATVAGGVVYGASTTAMASTAAGTAGQFLRSNGTSAPTWTTFTAAASGANSDITSLSGITTALSVAQGGTGDNSLTANKVLVGNGVSAMLQPTNLHWDNTNSRLGIGTSSPGYPLEVSGTVNRSTGTNSYGVLATGGAGTSSINQNVATSAYFSGGVAVANVIAFSDARIKKVIAVSDPEADLATLRKVKITDYSYIDVVNKGNRPKKGVIAQELEQVYPIAVNRSSDFIPNVYAMAGTVSLNTKAEELTLTVPKPHGFATGNLVRVITDGGQIEKSVARVVDANTFVLANVKEATGKVFVFGKKVDDFRAVDYDQLSTLNVSATQELAKRFEALQAENDKLKAQNEAIIKRLEALEKK